MPLPAILAGISAGLSIFGQIAAASGARRYANDVTEEGARMAADALRRGDEDARRYQMDLSLLLGRQRVSQAAQGVDVMTAASLTQGSAAAIRAETETFGAEDIRMIRENAQREAFALRRGANNQAAALRSQASTKLAGAFATTLALGGRGWEVYNENQRMRVAATQSRLDAFAAVTSRQRGTTSAGAPAFSPIYP